MAVLASAMAEATQACCGGAPGLQKRCNERHIIHGACWLSAPHQVVQAARHHNDQCLTAAHTGVPACAPLHMLCAQCAPMGTNGMGTHLLIVLTDCRATMRKVVSCAVYLRAHEHGRARQHMPRHAQSCSCGSACTGQCLPGGPVVPTHAASMTTITPVHDLRAGVGQASSSANGPCCKPQSARHMPPRAGGCGGLHCARR